MNILVLGSGGREHALAWRMAQDSSCTRMYIWPGNAGMTYLPFEHKDKLLPITMPYSRENLKRFIKDCDIELVVPGAEKYLYEGIADWCQEWHVPCFGPGAAAAMLEKSKLFSKRVMTDARIPTARYVDLTPTFHQDLSRAKEITKTFKMPVIKISGPSLGKGVFVCPSYEEASKTLDQIKQTPLAGIEEGLFVEEGLSGKEISLFYACHGLDFQFLGAAQDHKRLNDNDEGPNTGGMGAVSPVGWATPEFIQKATETFLVPTLKRMEELKTPFKGVLFLGLMVNGAEMNLLEYNVRFGDPETQTILPLIEGDFTQTLYSFAKGDKKTRSLSLKPMVAVHVVKSAKGYPGTFGTPIEKGQKISFLERTPSKGQFFFAGVKQSGPDLITDGGRVLGLTVWDESQEKARGQAYSKLQEISFAGEHFRSDIGARG